MFKVGDEVRIRLDSGWYHQAPEINGRIVSLDGDGWMSVRFNNGYCNSYEEKDLILLTSASSNNNSMPAKYQKIEIPEGLSRGFSAGKIKIGDKVKVPGSSSCFGGGNIWVEILGIVNGDEFELRHPGGRTTTCSCSDRHLPLLLADTNPVPEKPIEISANILDKVVLPKESREEIIAVLKQHQHQDIIFKDWGLSDTIEYGKGMTFLFYGTPGTGKTWCATQIAQSLGKELLTLTAAEVQSQEPGGANRAIQAAFKNAKEQKKVLLLDECDSLITARGDVGMILGSEINTLLTEIEKFEGVCILTTNRIETLDEALERRISLIIEFPKPDFETRVLLWTKLIPSKLPIDKNVKIEKLAEFHLTGGQIKNVILQTARMAASNNEKKIKFSYFEAAVARVNKSKNLMGQASRYQQITVKSDFSKTTGALQKVKVPTTQKVGQ